MDSDPIQDYKFENINDAINYVFQYEKTSLLSFERICEVLKGENLYYVSKKQGILPCSTIPRKRISFILSTSDQFIRGGSERTCMWALRPHNQLYLSDSTIRGFIEQVLTINGPMTIEQIEASSGLSGADMNVYHRFFHDNSSEFSLSSDGTYWFANQPIPRRMNFENINLALMCAMNEFPNGASIEEVSWFLCLSTIVGAKTITRRSISRELSRRPDLFLHVSRARYILNKSCSKSDEQQEQNSNAAFDDALAEHDQNDEFFDPSAFFNNGLFDFDM